MQLECSYNKRLDVIVMLTKDVAGDQVSVTVPFDWSIAEVLEEVRRKFRNAGSCFDFALSRPCDQARHRADADRRSGDSAKRSAHDIGGSARSIGSSSKILAARKLASIYPA